MYNKFPVFKNKNVRKVYNSHPELQGNFTAGEKLEIRIATMWLEDKMGPVEIAELLGVKIQLVGKIINACQDSFATYEKGNSVPYIANFYGISERLAFYYILMGIQNKINTMLGEQILNVMEEKND